MKYFLDLLDTKFLGNSTLSWGIFFLVTAVTFLVLIAIKNLLPKKYEKNEGRISGLFYHIASQTKFFFLAFISLYLGIKVLNFSGKIDRALQSIMVICFFVQMALWMGALLDYFLQRLLVKKSKDHPSSVPTLSFLGFFTRIGLWSLVLLLSLDNMGFNITTLIAGLGVGGIAIALACQKILEDIFSSLSIVLDKPFVNGDFITVGDFSGRVEKIGLKTTRIKGPAGEEIVFSNTDLLASRILNYRIFSERRVSILFGVIYETPSEKLRAIPTIMKDILAQIKGTRYLRCYLKGFGPSSLDFEFLYFVNTFESKDLENEVHLSLFERLAKEGIEFAYPAQRPVKARVDDPVM